MSFLYWQIFFCLKNRSVEKSLGSWRCCAAVYWRSGQDGSCSAGVCSLSPNENQMLMNQAIVACSEALALKPPLSHTQKHTHPPPHPPFTTTTFTSTPSAPLSLSFHPQLIYLTNAHPLILSLPGSCSGQWTSEASPVVLPLWPHTGPTCLPR